MSDFPAGNYSLTVRVTDCMKRTANDTVSLYLVNMLKARIRSIEAGGTVIQSTNCTNIGCNAYEDPEVCNPSGKMDAVDFYHGTSGYFYNRTSSPASSILYLTYDGSLLYDITDPNVEVIFPDKCNENGCVPKAFIPSH